MTQKRFKIKKVVLLQHFTRAVNVCIEVLHMTLNV